MKKLFLLCFGVMVALPAISQCWEDIPLIRKDTTLGQGIFVIEPKPGFRAKVTFEPEVVITNMFDNIDTQMTYSGSWYNGSTTAPNFHNNTIAWSNTVGSMLTFHFTGSKLEWFGEYKTTHGRASVTVNGIERIINLGSANTGPGIVAEWNLPQGNYTAVIKVLDSKPVVHDGMRITN